MRPPFLAVLMALAPALVAAQQPEGRRHAWMPAGGTGISLQGPMGWEVHGALLWDLSGPKATGPLYQIGPELALGAYFDSPFHWGQRLGVRQLLGPSGYWAFSLTGGVENHTTGFSLEDTRGFVQAGVNLLGLVSLEYGAGRPFTRTGPLHDAGRVVIRIDLDGCMPERIFTGVPIS